MDPVIWFACPECRHPIRALPGQVNKKGKCPKKSCRADLRIPSLCSACNCLAPTRFVAYEKHIGVVVLWFHESIQGEICKKCATEAFMRYTLVTALLGWWGLVSVVMTPIILVHNLVRFAACTSLESGPMGDWSTARRTTGLRRRRTWPPCARGRSGARGRRS